MVKKMLDNRNVKSIAFALVAFLLLFGTAIAQLVVSPSPMHRYDADANSYSYVESLGGPPVTISEEMGEGGKKLLSSKECHFEDVEIDYRNYRRYWEEKKDVIWKRAYGDAANTGTLKKLNHTYTYTFNDIGERDKIVTELVYEETNPEWRNSYYFYGAVKCNWGINHPYINLSSRDSGNAGGLVFFDSNGNYLGSETPDVKKRATLTLEVRNYKWCIKGKGGYPVIHKYPAAHYTLKVYSEPLEMVKVSTDKPNYIPPAAGKTEVVNIIATVTIGGVPSTGAVVSGGVERPNGIKDPLGMSDFKDKGDGNYTASYTLEDTKKDFPEGTYNITVKARDGTSGLEAMGEGRFIVGEVIVVSSDKLNYTPPQADKTEEVYITAIVKPGGKHIDGATVSGKVEKPDGVKDDLGVFSDEGGGRYNASYTLEESFPEGPYTITVKAKKDTFDGTGEGYFCVGKLPTLAGNVTDGHNDPLVNVPVTFNWDGKDLKRVYTNASGHFEIKEPRIVLNTEKEGYLTIKLMDQNGTIQILDKSPTSTEPNDPVTAMTNKFKLKASDTQIDSIDLSLNLVSLKEIEFSKTGNIKMATCKMDHLDDNAAIYYHTYQAVDFAEKCLKLELDLNLPLDICTYAKDDTSWEGPMTGHPATARIIINETDSDYTSIDRPRNREWHEFGHHVMADAFGNVLPDRAGEKNHGGYKNDHTTDSWTEGWAEFFACLVACDLGKTDWRTYLGQNLDDNVKCWNSTRGEEYEEYAIAGILIDLRDATTPYSVATDCDAIALTTEQIWDVVKTEGSTAGVGNGHVFDLKDLYDAFNDSATRQKLGYRTERLNDIFITHGAFYDANDNHQYDAGETVGNAANKTRPNRRKAPLIDGSYILFSAKDSSTGTQIDTNEFTVKVKYDPPYDIYDHQYTTRAAENKLSFSLLPTSHPRKAYISAHSEGYYDSEELEIESSFYFEKMQEPYNPAHEYFLEHDFRLAPAQVPDFIISAAPSSETIFQGEEAQFDIKLRPLKGFESPVSLSLSGLPAGASYEFSSVSFTPPGASRLTIKTPSTVPTGSFVLSVEGKSDTLVHSCKITLTNKKFPSP